MVRYSITVQVFLYIRMLNGTVQQERNVELLSRAYVDNPM